MDSPKTPERSELRRSPSRPYQRRQREAPSGTSNLPEPGTAAPGEPASQGAGPAPAERKARPRRRAAAGGAELAPLGAAPAAATPDVADVPSGDAVVEWTLLPGPRELPTAPASTPTPAPGLVPAGDSRSLRNGDRFVLVYRVHCSVITRSGRVGLLGDWSSVDYPTPAAASHAYARSCSHWVSEGFSDYRG